MQEQSALHAQPAENLRWGAPKRAVQIGYFFAAYVAQRSLPVERNFMGRPVAAQLVEAACRSRKAEQPQAESSPFSTPSGGCSGHI